MENECGVCILQQDSGEDGGGENKAAEEQERGGGEADEARHCIASTVWSRCHRSNPGNFPSKVSILRVVD